jgi:lipoprotein-anchoring transpeptidase ErfK/SrfK
MRIFPLAGSTSARVRLLVVTAGVGGVLVGLGSPSASAQTEPPRVPTVIVSVEPTTAAPSTQAPTTTAAPTTAASTAAPTTAAPVTTAPTTTTPATTTPATTSSPTTRATAAPRPTPTTAAPKTPTTRPKPEIKRAPSGGTSIEIDISRQTLYLYKGGSLYRTIGISSGSGRRFCEKNGRGCQTAHTPRGRFRIGGRVNGWRTSRLGKLYNPLYFTGGYAIHGGSLPGYPASHGCVRISMGNARWFPRAVPGGTPVWIHD